LNKGIDDSLVSPIKVCRLAPEVSHLLFADDTLFFFKATHGQALSVKHALDTYATTTGQLINLSKCSMLFGEACPETIKEMIRSDLGVTSLFFEEKYLGLPTPDGRMSHGKLQNLQAQLTKRLLMWGDGHLAQAGRGVLLNQ
jgi:hypothetical protein